MSEAKEPSSAEILDAIEGKGYALTLEARRTAQKWVTGKNLFMGIVGPDGTAVRNAYGEVALEVPLRVGQKLNWYSEDGRQVANLSQALRNTVKRGLVRRGSHLHSAMGVLALLVQ